MSCEDHSIQTLRESGHRLTPQRVLILSALRSAEGHMTAAGVLDHVRESYPYIDASTVYRTLGVLKNLRLISENNITGGESEYEWLHQNRHPPPHLPRVRRVDAPRPQLPCQPGH